MGVVVLSILAMTLSTARSEAHCFSHWHYPWKQRCFTAMAPKRFASDTKLASREPETFRERHEQITIPLPALDFEACQDADERLQGIAKLRALSDGL
jgi:hypothetical protein